MKPRRDVRPLLGDDDAEQIVGRDLCVPDVEEPGLGVLRDPRAVPVERGTHRPVRFLRIRHPGVASQHLQARNHPHQIPLERARKRLVEVTEVERELPLRRGPQPEVEDMSVTAQLHGQTARGPRGEVGGHDGGGTPVVGPRRGRHAAVADRHQVGRPHGVLGEHGSQGVMTALVGVPVARILARQSRPSRPSDRPTLLEGQMVRARGHTHEASLSADLGVDLTHDRRPRRANRRHR